MNFRTLTHSQWLGWVAALTCLGIAASAAAHGGTPIGRRFSLDPVVEGLELGVGFAVAPDGTLFIAQKGGVVRVFRGGQLLASPFVDLTAEVNNTSDRGLLGIAVHPSFPAQPYVYLLYTYDPAETASRSGLSGPNGGGARVARLLRVTADAATNHATATAERVVLLGTGSTWDNIGNPSGRNDYGAPSCGSRGAYVRDCLPADELSHTIGTVAFGPDGMLYAGNGDGCDYTRRQDACTRSLDLDSLAGKIMRIDPITGDAPADNPFYDGDPQSNRSKVYQLGLRNPFRFTFDSEGGGLYIGDVGWNTWEEINHAGPGANFGWPCYEGGDAQNVEQSSYAGLSRCAELRDSGAPVTPGIYAYTHAGNSSSVQAGDVYHGDLYPPEYEGALFYSDYNKQELRTLHFDGSGNVLFSDTLATGIQGMTQISADPATGEMLIMRITTGTGGPGSVIERLHYDPPAPGVFADGVYTVRAEYNDACVQAYPETTRRVWFWTVTDPAYIQTAPCGDDDAQQWMLVDDGDGAYTLRSESQADYLAASGGDVVPTGSAGSNALWRMQGASSGGYLLVNEATGQCAVTDSTSSSASLGVTDCNDTAAQRFDITPYGNLPPVIEPIPRTEANVGDNVSFFVVASDPEGAALTYSATGLPEGITIVESTGEIVGQPQSMNHGDVIVTVSDGFLTASTMFHFHVYDDRIPVVTLQTPVEGTRYSPDELITFSGTAVDWQGYPITGDGLQWVMYSHHNEHIHVDALPPTSGETGSFIAEDHGDNTWLELCLIATDEFDRQAQACRELRPREVDYTITTVPAGLTIPWEGVPRQTPFTVTTHVGGVRDLSAPLTQSGYAFESWSDGGIATHPITVGNTDTTITATYVRVAPESGTYGLQATHSGKCMRYLPAEYFLFWQTEPARLRQYPCTGASDRVLNVQDNGDGTYRLLSSGGAVSVSGNSTSDGAAIVPASYSGSTGQRWEIAVDGEGFTVRNPASGRCLTVQGASNSDDASYTQRTCNGSDAQRFVLIP